MTIIEMLVATFILSIGVMGVAVLLVSNAETAALTRAEGDANALARGELETLRSFDYDLIGITTTADGYVREFDGRQTVTESTGNLVNPYDKVEIDATTFGIQRSVTWAAVGDNERAYKIVVVTVEWNTASGPRSFSVQTGLHEGVAGA